MERFNAYYPSATSLNQKYENYILHSPFFSIIISNPCINLYLKLLRSLQSSGNFYARYIILHIHMIQILNPA
ncbi:MAG: hypothetical protein CLLPBCKN_002193 [Chroococcidiopsis cubana SAG 39.79]|nr:hypothetical protein [Chroococcidiopsis cubana SAG 39.79]